MAVPPIDATINLSPENLEFCRQGAMRVALGRPSGGEDYSLYIIAHVLQMQRKKFSGSDEVTQWYGMGYVQSHTYALELLAEYERTQRGNNGTP